jgi:hypothetical protein
MRQVSTVLPGEGMFGFDEAEAEQGAASVHTVPSHNQSTLALKYPC